MWLGAAAVAATFAAVVWQGVWPKGGRNSLLSAATFVTQQGETSTVQLGDGSIVRLAPESRLQVLEAAGERRVRLEGRAFFAITSDPDSPFTVLTQAGDAVVRGTRFDLQVRDQELQLMVLEGAVELRTPDETIEIGPGQMSQVARDGELRIRRVDNTKEVLEWFGDFVAFESTPLVTVAEEMERRFGMRTVILDASLAARRVTSWSTKRTAADIMAAVCVAVNAQCSISDSLTTIRP